MKPNPLHKFNKTRYSTPPCKDCEDRHTTCHSTCEKYAEYKKNIEIAKGTTYARQGEFNDYCRSKSKKGRV